MPAGKYRGYSSVANTGINTGLFDLQLVKQDILNAFMTRLGERRGRPLFGSIIHDLLMEPFDTTTEQVVLADAQRILRAEPRVRINSVKATVDPDNHQIQVTAKLLFIEFNMVDNFDVTFVETL